MIRFLFISFLLALRCSSSPSASPESRVQEAIDGLFEYFWSNDPQDSSIGFFFACGEIGGLGPYAKNWTECSCDSPDYCPGCYRWWDATILESIADHGIFNKTTQRASVADNFFAHSPYNSHWSSCTYIDDFLWYGITYLKVYEWIDVSENVLVYCH